MKLCYLIMVLLVSACFAGADTLWTRFELECPLEETFSADQRARVVIPDAVFGQARNFPNDIRIIDTEGTQWPSFLYVPKEGITTASIRLNIRNQVWVVDPEPYLQFEVVIPSINGETPVHNRLELNTSGQEFVRRVEIRAGDDAAGRMAAGYLIEFSGQRDARNRIIRYPDSDAGRLRVRIYPNAQSAQETFEISGVSLHHQTEKAVERKEVSFSQISVDASDHADDAQVHVLDLGHPNRPVERIQFEVENASYARRVSVYGRNSEQEEWQAVGGGEIHALPDDRNDRIRLNARHRFLRVLIYHYDDLPLEIRSIRLTAVPRYLVFEAASESPASLYFRAWDMAAPRFDLRKRVADGEIDRVPVVDIGDAQPNARIKINPWRRYSRLLAGLAVAGVSLLVIWIIVSMLRQQKFPAER